MFIELELLNLSVFSKLSFVYIELSYTYFCYEDYKCQLI